MKIACDKCLTVKNADLGFPKGWMKVKVNSLDVNLCEICSEGLWQAIDCSYPPVILQPKIEKDT